MRIRLHTIALRFSEQLTFPEGAVVTGRDLGEGETLGEGEIPMALAQARLDADTADLVGEGVDLSPAVGEALSVMLRQVAVFHGQIVVFLDAVQSGSDDALRAVFEEVSRVAEGFEPTVQRISELRERVHPRFVFEPVTNSAARAEHTFQDQVSDSAAFSNGASEGAAAPPAAPEIPATSADQAGDVVGGVAQLEERLVHTQDVGGSSPPAAPIAPGEPVAEPSAQPKGRRAAAKTKAG